ncbi:ABC transporter ATP-binding protein [Hymenobacter radiodurans]|uniref:ABC transporter ATP-binding protein n=1 Tax=Hymenobacter radiodurans TaxID=2496028 RepID=UPI0010591511|nr:polysaccharide ABC transporter ATP-binding protein [Hymenobacter radiodurans]
MSDIAIRVEELGKLYRLGEIGTGTITHDLNRWWARLRGQEDPFAKIGETNDRTAKGQSDYVWSLKDVNFEVKQGEVLGIIGRNGAGKSTLLKILSKVTAPTTGRIKIKGRIASLLEVGTGFHPELTGRENIFLNGAILGMSKAEIRSKFDEIVDFSGVERYIDTPVKRYSSGMYVRLAFAVSAFLEPEILIVDEVLAVGDAEFQKKCLGRMKDVSVNDGRTVLFVSHNMSAVANLCTRICYLENGNIIKQGNVKECIDLYFSRSTNNQQTELKKILKSDPDFDFLDFKLSSKRSNDTFYTSDTISFYYDYLVKRDMHGLRIGFDLVDNMDTVIFRSFHDDLEKETSFFELGAYRSYAEIPANILAEGDYYIKLRIGVHNVRWIIHDEVSVKVSIAKVDSLNSNYNDNRPGLVAPVINWETKHHNTHA